MDRLGFKKGRQFFDTAPRPSHVTFDDGRQRKRNFPWGHYVEARWDYEEPESIYVTIGNWLVVISGHNIASLYTAIEDHTLTRVGARPDLEDNAAHADDSFATEIRFVKAPESGKRGQTEMDLGA
jgi:hypothetical protein